MTCTEAVMGQNRDKTGTGARTEVGTWTGTGNITEKGTVGW